MVFDVTNIDKKLLIQTLFLHADPIGRGWSEYDFRKAKGDNVDGLTDKECDFLLNEYYTTKVGPIDVLDYYKGKPIKLLINKKRNGQETISAASYDTRNGKYRFFEAMLNIFSVEEIQITKRKYDEFVEEYIDQHTPLDAEQENIFKSLLKNTIKKQNEKGAYWIVNNQAISYKSPFDIE